MLPVVNEAELNPTQATQVGETIKDIHEDRNGQLWFGFTGGLFRFDGAGVVNVDWGGF